VVAYHLLQPAAPENRNGDQEQPIGSDKTALLGTVGVIAIRGSVPVAAGTDKHCAPRLLVCEWVFHSAERKSLGRQAAGIPQCVCYYTIHTHFLATFLTQQTMRSYHQPCRTDRAAAFLSYSINSTCQRLAGSCCSRARQPKSSLIDPALSTPNLWPTCWHCRSIPFNQQAPSDLWTMSSCSQAFLCSSERRVLEWPRNSCSLLYTCFRAHKHHCLGYDSISRLASDWQIPLTAMQGSPVVSRVSRTHSTSCAFVAVAVSWGRQLWGSEHR